MNEATTFITREGYPAKILLTSMGHHCGYVMLPKNHPLYGVGYGEEHPCLGLSHYHWETYHTPCGYYHVHGGITYAAEHEDNTWAYGFDCAHSGDSPDMDWLKANNPSLAKSMSGMAKYGTFKDAAYVERECRSLATQLYDTACTWAETTTNAMLKNAVIYTLLGFATLTLSIAVLSNFIGG